MQIGPFTNFIAQELCVEAATVAIYARELRKAGLLTTGARGVNAPHMRPLDAARLLIALMATDRPSEAVASVERWGAMWLDESVGELPDYLTGEPTLEQALVRIIAVDSDPSTWPQKWPSFEVARNEKSAMLEWGLSNPPRAIFRDTTPKSYDDRRELAGIRRSTLIAPAVLMNIAAGLWSDRFRGVDVQGLPLDLKHSWNHEGTYEERQRRFQDIYDYVRAKDSNWQAGAD